MIRFDENQQEGRRNTVAKVKVLVVGGSEGGGEEPRGKEHDTENIRSVDLLMQ